MPRPLLLPCAVFSLLGLWLLLSLRPPAPPSASRVPRPLDPSRILAACQAHLNRQGFSGSVLLPQPSLVPSGYASRLTTDSHPAQRWTVTGDWTSASQSRPFTCFALEEAGKIQVRRVTWP